LMAFVLVVGLAGAGGLVYGDSAQDTSGISITVEDVSVEIIMLEQPEENIDLLADGAVNTADTQDTNNDGDLDSPEPIYIQIEVTNLVDDNVDTVTANFDYVGAGDTTGDSIDSYSLTDVDFTVESQNTDENWVIYEAELEIDNMMRYGEWGVGTHNDAWQVEATVTDNDANTYTDTKNFDVSTFVQISVDGTDITGSGAPGQTLGVDISWDTTDSIPVFRINAEYELSETIAADTTDDDWIPTNMDVDYDGYRTGNPINYEEGDANSVVPIYTLLIPDGTAAGTYTGTAQHTLTNAEN